jgi:hypothetical protein
MKRKTEDLRSTVAGPRLDGANSLEDPLPTNRNPVVKIADEGTNSGSLSSDADPGNKGFDRIEKTDNYGIKILHDSVSAILDIVFVHGLTGSAYSTWFHEDSGKHWPRDFIKNDISDARVMTFGYDTGTDASCLWGQGGISGHAKDLLGKLARKRQQVVGVSVSSPRPLTPSLAAFCPNI